MSSWEIARTKARALLDKLNAEERLALEVEFHKPQQQSSIVKHGEPCPECTRFGPNPIGRCPECGA